MKRIPQDIVGSIAVLKFPRGTFWLTKKLRARRFLKNNPSVRTVLEKTKGFSGKLRTPKTRYLAGVRTKEATYRENGCIFKYNIDDAYFSPRLSNERKIIADEIVRLSRKKGTKILVMFAGVSPYPIVIARKLKQAGKEAIIISNELNKKASRYGRKNVLANKLQDYITFLDGDARKLPEKTKHKFDIILMPRPNLKENFLKIALNLSKSGTIIFYHGFGTKKEVLEEIKRETKEKIGKISIRKAGDIGARRFRWQARFKVL